MEFLKKNEIPKYSNKENFAEFGLTVNETEEFKENREQKRNHNENKHVVLKCKKSKSE